MLRTRVMPCLLLKGEGLVKTIKFSKERYVGDPINAVRIFNQKEVDELILFDIDVSSQKSGINFPLIERITSECFMPLCYGGGVKSLEDFRKLFYLGVEKVSVSSLLFENPEVVRQAIAIYGSQSIIATLDIKRAKFSKKYRVHTHSAKKKTAYDPLQATRLAYGLGVGEIILNSIDRDGTWDGFDLELVRSVTEAVSVPIVAVGGAGKLEDISMVVKDSGASAVGLGSMAVFQAKDMGVLIKFPKIIELEKLLS